jgi:hypothetical protein
MYPRGPQELCPTFSRCEFGESTFLLTNDPAFPRLKLTGVEATIATESMDQEVVVDVNEFVRFILKETLTGAVRVFDHQLLERRVS